MPLIILLSGIVLIAAGLNNRLSELIDLIKEDLAPTDGAVPFGTWTLAIVVLGSIGYIKEARSFANTFLVLIFVAIFLSNRGFYARFTEAFAPASLTSGGTSGGGGISVGNTGANFLDGAGASIGDVGLPAGGISVGDLGSALSAVGNTNVGGGIAALGFGF